MKRKRVYLMVGAPGAGKSTWVQNRMKNEPGLWCSRDKVRFSMVREDEDYFSKENEVFKKWTTYINNGISSKAHSVIYVDATHISQASRNRTLDRLKLDNVDVIPVVFKTSLEKCIENNNKRTGREKVPEKVIKSMYEIFSNSSVSFGERHAYKEIIVITDNNTCVVKEGEV